MFLLLYIALLLISIAVAAPSPNNANTTLWKAIETTGYQTLYSALQQPRYDTIRALLDNKQQKTTFFLPTDDALRAAKIDLNNASVDTLMYHLVAGQHTSSDLLGGQRHYLQTLSTSNHSILVVGANSNNPSALQLEAGSLEANVVAGDIQCSNGVIHPIDHFLQPPASTLDTISALDELQSYEELVKTLNLTDIIGGTNVTLFAARNDAWTKANGSSMAYGVLVHNLRFQVVHGSYFAHDFVNGSSLETDYAKSRVTLVQNSDNTWGLVDEATDDTAAIVRTDIITSGGIIHIVDKVMTADGPVTNGRSVFSPNPTTLRKKPTTAEPTRATALQVNAATPLNHGVSLALFFALLLVFFL